MQNKQIINLHVVGRYYATSSCHFDYERRHLGRARAIVGWNFEIIYYYWPDRIYRLSRMRSFPNTNKHRSIDRTMPQLKKLDHKPRSKFYLERQIVAHPERDILFAEPHLSRTLELTVSILYFMNRTFNLSQIELRTYIKISMF